MKTARSHAEIETNIEYARMDDELFALLQGERARDALRAALIARWFSEQSDALRAEVRAHRTANFDERVLRDRVATPDLEIRDVEPARSVAFRRLVLEAYDYRYAATGWRIIVPGGSTLVEAAHLIPFAESHNDDPRNGLALTPTYHKALDKHLIAPADMRWHVSPVFDSRIPDNRPFVELDGRDVIFMGDERFRPSEASLRWRFERLVA